MCPLIMHWTFLLKAIIGLKVREVKWEPFPFSIPFPFLGSISGILLDVHVCINMTNEISCNLYSFGARRLYSFSMFVWWFPDIRKYQSLFIVWNRTETKLYDAMWWFYVEDINNITSHSTPKEMYIILERAFYIVLFF